MVDMRERWPSSDIMCSSQGIWIRDVVGRGTFTRISSIHDVGDLFERALITTSDISCTVLCSYMRSSLTLSVEAGHHVCLGTSFHVCLIVAEAVRLDSLATCLMVADRATMLCGLVSMAGFRVFASKPACQYLLSQEILEHPVEDQY